MKTIRGLAVGALLGLATMSGTAAAAAANECAFDYPILTERECQGYHTRWLQAKSNSERNAVLDDLRRFMVARAQSRGVSLDDWRSYVFAVEVAGDVSR